MAHILLALHPVLSCRLDCCLGTVLFEVIVRNSLCHDEPSLKVRVDHPRRLGRLRPLPHSPRPDLISPHCEEALHVERLQARAYDLWQAAHAPSLLEVRRPLVPPHLLQLLFQGHRDRDESTPPVGIHPLLDLGKPLVLLSYVVTLTQIQQPDVGFACQQQHLVQKLNLGHRPIPRSNVLPPLEMLEDLCHHLDLNRFLGRRASLHVASCLVGMLKPRFCPLHVLCPQLRSDDLHIPHGVHCVLHMRNVRIVKHPHHVEHAVSRRDVAQELVAEPLPLGRPPHKPGNVRHLKVCLDPALGRVRVA
mmetsp:Transcript_45/g.117  ORF Transcript_45/g.117 Transcript_45/m.117 type:complete len:305 (+) Transcript_45:136-1050(+)